MKRLVYASCTVAIVAIAVTGVWRAMATAQDDDMQTANAGTASRNDLTLRDMANESQLIATGRCVGTRSEWTQDNRVLVTLATIAIDEVIKGSPTDTITVVLPGGVDANRRIPVAMTYPGAPQISPEEEVFLFLSSDDSVANGYSVFGFAEGKYSIVEDQSGGKVVVQNFTKTRVQKGPGLVRGNRQVVPLSEFKAKVRDYVGQ